jgi:tetratricopeptide (TPR) repeat protein
MGLAYAFFDWRWHDAELHFLKAIERDTYSGAGHVWRALACLIPAGKLEQARAEFAEAEQLSPPAFLEDAQLLSLYFSEQYDSILQRTDGTGLTPWQQWLRGCALEGLGRTAAAIAVLELHNGDARMIATLGHVCGVAGEHAKALEALAQLNEQGARGKWISNYALALIQVGLDNRAEALNLLHEALREREPMMAFLAVDPRLSALRGNPKFQALVRRIQLSDVETRENTQVMRESAS